MRAPEDRWAPSFVLRLHTREIGEMDDFPGDEP
jgi:hypothetical protein